MSKQTKKKKKKKIWHTNNKALQYECNGIYLLFRNSRLSISEQPRHSYRLLWCCSCTTDCLVILTLALHSFFHNVISNYMCRRTNGLFVMAIPLSQRVIPTTSIKKNLWILFFKVNLNCYISIINIRISLNLKIIRKLHDNYNLKNR